MYGDKHINNEMDGDPISNAVSRLERVSAPANFEDNVMRAIRQQASEAPARSYAWLKIALPTAALLLLAAFFGLSSLTTGEITDIRVAGGEEKLADPFAPGGMDRGEVAGVQNGITNREKDAPGRRSNSNNSQGSSPSGGSETFGANPGDEGTLGKGLNQNGGSSRPAPKTTVRVLDILQFAGLRSEIRGGEIVVTSVVDSSPSAKAGLQNGDVLVAVNEVALTATATIPGGTDIRTIRIRRKGQTMTLRF